MPSRRIPEAYFITFSTHGTWLHGNAKGSFAKGTKDKQAEFIEHDPLLLHVRKGQLKHPPFKLGLEMIRPVDEAIRIVCNTRKWKLHALNVRTNHVHVVVTAPVSPGRVLGDFKRWATRRLRDDGLVGNRPIWTEDGSKRWLWTPADVGRAVEYVLRGQGVDLRGDVPGG